MAQDSIKRLYVQNVADWEKMLSKGKFSDRMLGVRVIERGWFYLLARRKAD